MQKRSAFIKHVFLKTGFVYCIAGEFSITNVCFIGTKKLKKILEYLFYFIFIN